MFRLAKKILTGAGLIMLMGAMFTFNTAFVFAETVADLEITDFPDTIRTFTDFRFTVNAVDSIGNPVENFTGTVTFTSATDSNAILPPEYTFTVEDKGIHEFTESYYFTETGAQTLTVTDTLTPTLETTIDVTVTDEEAPSETSLTITSPSPGVTTNSIITVIGQTTPGLEVSIYNDAELLGSVDATVEGIFEFQTSVLADGTYAILVQAGDAESDIINIVINTEAPDLEFVQLSPEIIQPGATSEITIRLKDTARSVQALLNGTQTTLTRDSINNKQFSGILAAPITEGSFPITLNIEDELGNKKNNVPTQKSLDVSTSAPGNDGDIIIGSENPTFLIPSQVTGIQAVASDKQVNLSWQPANANAGIKNYIIYYGTEVNNLSQKIETFSAETTWFVPNLTNETTYYFSVFALDNSGNRSDLGSQIIAANPSTNGQSGIVGSKDGQITVNTQPDTGPGTIMLVSIASISIAGALRRRKHKLSN